MTHINAKAMSINDTDYSCHRTAVELFKAIIWGPLSLQVEYLGYYIDVTGIHQTEKKIKAVKVVLVPTDVSHLQAFIGLKNYYGKFIPHIVTNLAPLYKLVEKDQKWVWSVECESTIHKCQSLLTSTTP